MVRLETILVMFEGQGQSSRSLEKNVAKVVGAT